LALRKGDALEVPATGVTPETPPNTGNLSTNSVKQPPGKPIGHCTLHDITGKEINLDGTPKVPYKHPNFGKVTAVIHDHVLEADTHPKQPVIMPLLEEQGEPQGEGNMIHSRQRATQANLDMRRGIPAV